MKFLLTSAGITNDIIRKALVDLLSKPIAESKALCIPTAIYAEPGGPGSARQEIREWGEMGWKAFGVLELTALPSTLQEHWLPSLEAADALLVGGGNGLYLSYWMQQSGLAEHLPKLLQEKVYVGVSAGSALVTRRINVNREEPEKTGVYHDDETTPPNAGSDKTLGLVDLTLRPHLGADSFPAASLANMEHWAAKVGEPLYAFDDETAIKVVDGAVEVVSEGQWRRFAK
jgi:dipeptidase E